MVKNICIFTTYPIALGINIIVPLLLFFFFLIHAVHPNKMYMSSVVTSNSISALHMCTWLV